MSNSYALDRSRIKARQACPMYRYVSYDLPNGPGVPSGVTPAFPGFNFAIGLTVHKGLEILLKTGDIAEALAACKPLLQDYFASFEGHTLDEMRALCQGMVYGWYRQRYAALLTDYEIIDTEKSYTWKLNEDFNYNFRVDALIRRRDDGRIAVLDFKTAKKCDGEWARMFEHDLQPILYCRAVEEVLGITDVLGIQFEGLAKGFARPDTAKKSPYYGLTIQYSPYCYGYIDRDGGLHAEYNAAYTRIRTWEHKTVPEWYDQILAASRESEDLFTIVPPIKPSARVTEITLASILREEEAYVSKVRRCHNVQESYPDLLIPTENLSFERHTDHCLKYGSEYRCFAYDICWTQGVREDLASIGLVPRVPNHSEEVF